MWEFYFGFQSDSEIITRLPMRQRCMVANDNPCPAWTYITGVAPLGSG
jgi:hypothetical protein